MVSNIGLIPLRELSFRITKGTTPTKGEGFVSQGINYIKSESITPDGKIDKSKFAFIDESTHSALERSQLRSGNVLFSMAGVYLGKTSVVQQEHLPANTNQAVGIISLDESRADPYFVHYALQSPACRGWVARSAAQSAQPNFNLKEIGDLPIPKFSLPVQKQISRILWTLDGCIDLNRRINQTLEAMAQAIFKSWFVDFDPVKAKIAAIQEGRDPLRAAMSAISGKPDTELDALPPEQYEPLAATAALFPDEMEESALGEMPRGWRVSTLGEECAYLNRGISPKYLEEGGLLVLNQKCVRDFSLDPSKGRRHDPTLRGVSGRLLEVGDVLVNSTGVGTLGRVAQVLRLSEPTIVDSHVTVVRAGSRLNSAFLGQWFVLKQPEIEALGEGSTGQTELSRGKLAVMPVLVPDGAALGAFDAKIAPLKSLISTKDQESLVLRETRDVLLPKLLSGELSPRATSEVAEA